MGARIGVGDPARNLFHVEHVGYHAIERESLSRFRVRQRFWKEGENRRRRIAVLSFTSLEINGSSVEPARGSCFEAAHFEAEIAQVIAEGRRGVAHSSPGLVLKPHVKESPHECASGDDDCIGKDSKSQVGLNAGRSIAASQDGCDIALEEVDIGLLFQFELGPVLIGFLVTLSPGCADAGALVGVQHAKLDRRRIGVDGHEATQGIDFTNHMAFGEATDRRVARHLSNGVEVLGEHQGLAAETRRSHGRFDAGMPGSDNKDIVMFGIRKHVSNCSTWNIAYAPLRTKQEFSKRPGF